MTAQDPMIQLPLLSAALGRSEQSLYQDILLSRMPRHDTLVPLKHAHARAWKLSTLRAWRPDVAARCQGILQALETHTLTAA